jgi:tyrosinase
MIAISRRLQSLETNHRTMSTQAPTQQEEKLALLHRPRFRKDIRELEYEYDHGTKKPLETLIKAFRGVARLPAKDPNSFFVIGGYHGMPFRGAGWGNPAWWGGYCHHGNVLFPLWHRAYCLRLEDALRSIEGCSDVTLPYWDEVGDETKEKGLPLIFLAKTFTIGGETFPNPLYSYKLVAGVHDNLGPIPDADYSKPPGYQTVRYPFSGLVGPKDIAATDAHNATMNALGDDVTNGYLNGNVKNWLAFSITNHEGHTFYTGARAKYRRCLDAPNYTVFSNTTSATQYNEDNFGVTHYVEAGAPGQATEAVVPIESPHNDIHLALGGWEIPGVDYDNIAGANGDMGENDTAGLDPIFFFHHSFIDKTFWQWQQKWGKTTKLDVIPHYPGTNSVDSQGPTPGVSGNVWLDMKSPLYPFTNGHGKTLTGDVSRLSSGSLIW